MDTLFTFFLLVTINMIRILTATLGVKDQLYFFNSLELRLSTNIVNEAFEAKIWQSTRINYLSESTKPPGSGCGCESQISTIKKSLTK
jgi:hypothetical protein